MDIILLRDLEARCIVGVLPHERKRKRKVIINLRLECDLRKACKTDDIGATVDYRTVQEEVLRVVGASKDKLVERLAQRIADAALSVRGVKRVTVTLDKPAALRHCRSAAVIIDRYRRSISTYIVI